MRAKNTVGEKTTVTSLKVCPVVFSTPQPKVPGDQGGIAFGLVRLNGNCKYKYAATIKDIDIFVKKVRANCNIATFLQI